MPCSRATTKPLALCERHGGSVAELRHDAVLAVFGMPVAHEDDMQRALRAAVELGARTEHLPYGLRGRAGVCTGDVVALAGRHGAPVIGEAIISTMTSARTRRPSGAGSTARSSGARMSSAASTARSRESPPTDQPNWWRFSATRASGSPAWSPSWR